MAKLKNTRAVKELNVGDYDGIYLAGGHGTCWDFDDAAVTKAVGAPKKLNICVACEVYCYLSFIIIVNKLNKL